MASSSGRARDLGQAGLNFPFLLWCSGVPLSPLPSPQLGPGKHQYDSHACLPLGLKGTYQGLTATVLKQGSNQAIRFFVMTSLRNWYRGMYLLGLHPQDPTSNPSGLGSSSSVFPARTWPPGALTLIGSFPCSSPALKSPPLCLPITF